MKEKQITAIMVATNGSLCPLVGSEKAALGIGFGRSDTVRCSACLYYGGVSLTRKHKPLKIYCNWSPKQ